MCEACRRGAPPTSTLKASSMIYFAEKPQQHHDAEKTFHCHNFAAVSLLLRAADKEGKLCADRSRQELERDPASPRSNRGSITRGDRETSSERQRNRSNELGRTG